MDLLVRFFDNSANTVNTRFYDSRFLGHATHQDLHKQFNGISNESDSKKLFQISLDGHNVNLKFYEAVVTDRNKNEQHLTLVLRNVHGKFERFSKELIIFFHESPATKEDYTTKTEFTQFPQYFCGARYEHFVTNYIK